MACPSTGPGSVSTHLVAITPPPVAPAPSSPHLTFITALYAERCMTFIAEHIVRAVGRVSERESRVEAAGLKELEAALGEDQSIWTWLKSMRVRAYIEAEIAAADLRLSNTSGKGRVPAQGSGPRRATLTGAGSGEAACEQRLGQLRCWALVRQEGEGLRTRRRGCGASFCARSLPRS